MVFASSSLKLDDKKTNIKPENSSSLEKMASLRRNPVRKLTKALVALKNHQDEAILHTLSLSTKLDASVAEYLAREKRALRRLRRNESNIGAQVGWASQRLVEIEGMPSIHVPGSDPKYVISQFDQIAYSKRPYDSQTLAQECQQAEQNLALVISFILQDMHTILNDLTWDVHRWMNHRIRWSEALHEIWNSTVKNPSPNQERHREILMNLHWRPEDFYYPRPTIHRPHLRGS